MRKTIRLHSNGNTWKYTLDIFEFRLCWWRRKKVNRLNQRVPIITFNWG